MAGEQDDTGDEHSKKDYMSSESKKRSISTPHTPQIPVSPNNTGYTFPPSDISDEKQRVIIPVPSNSSDSTGYYNSPQQGLKDSNEYHFHSTENEYHLHSTEDREEVAKPMFESEKSNKDSLFLPEESRAKVIMPVPSNEPEGKKAGDWDENIIIPTSAHGSESTDTYLWAQHREVKQGTQKLIMPVHYSSEKDEDLQYEDVADQHEHFHPTETNTAVQAKRETTRKYDEGVTLSEIEKQTGNMKLQHEEMPSVTEPLQSETDIKKTPMALKSLKEEQSVQKTSVTQFLYNKEYKSPEKSEGYEIKDLDAYIEDFADETSLINLKQPQNISAADKSQVKTEKIKPLESLDKKEKGKAYSEITNKHYKSAEKPAKGKTQYFDISVTDFDDEDSLIHSKQPQKVSAADKSQVKTEKIKPLESLDKKEKGKVYGEITNKEYKSAEKPAKSERQDFDIYIKDFDDEDSLIHSKQPEKISATDRSQVKTEKIKPLESLDKKEKGKAYGEITNSVYKSAEKTAKIETKDLDPSIKDFADEASLIHSKQPHKISAVDKRHVKIEKDKPPESWEKKEKGKAYGEITNKKYKSAEKSGKSETQDLDPSIKDFADEASLVHSKQPHKVSAMDKRQVIKIVKVKSPESWEIKEKGKTYGEITNKQYKTAEKPGKSETQDLDPSIKDFGDEASLHSKQPHKIPARDKSHFKTDKVKPSDSLEEKEKADATNRKADNLTEYAKQEKTSLARKSSIQKDSSVKYVVSEGKRDSEIQRKVLTNNIKTKENNQSEPKSKISDIKRIYRDEPPVEKEKQGRMTDDNVSAIEKYLQQEISKVSPEKVRRDMTGQTKGGESYMTKNEKTEANTESELKAISSKHSTEQKVYKWQKIHQNEDDNILPYTKSDTTDMPTKRQEIKKAKDALKPIKESLVREQQKIPYQEGSPPKETKSSSPKETKESPPKETKESPPKETKESSSKETKESSRKETKGSSPKVTKGPPPRETKGSPPRETKGSPPIETKGPPTIETKGSPPIETKGSPPKETKGSSPKGGSPSGAAKPDKHTSFDKYSSGKNDPNMHSTFDKYSTVTNKSDKHTSFDKYSAGINESDKYSSFDKYSTRKNDPNLHSPPEKYSTTRNERTEEILYDKQNTHFKTESKKATHPQKPDHTNLTVPVSHHTVTDAKDTKLGSHKSQDINKQKEIDNQSSKRITLSQAPNLSKESTTRQGVTSQSITLLDSPPRYMVKDIKESEVTKPSGGELQPEMTQNTAWSVHKLSSVNEKYLGKSGHPSPWGDAGTFLPWVTYAAQKKNNQNNLITEQTGPNHHGNGSGSGSGSPVWQFLGRQYDVFKDNFNNHTIRGRANVAKATLLAVGLFTVWQMLKPKKCELTFQRCTECGSITPMEKRH